MATSPIFVVTDAGLAAAAVAHPEGPFIHITAFKVGAAYGYVPDKGATDLNGALLYEGQPASYAFVGDNTLNVICKVAPDAGPFDFGEVGLYLQDGTLFAKAAFEKPQTKLSALGTNVLSTFTFNCLLQLEQTASVIKVTTESGAPPSLLEVEMWSDVVPPGTSANPDVQMILVKELDANGNSSLIHQADPNHWTVGTNYHFVANANVTSSTVNSVDVDATGLDPTMISAVNRNYVIETTDGYLRSATSLSQAGGSFHLPLNPEPLTTPPQNYVSIFSNTPVAVGGGGGSGPGAGITILLSLENVILPASSTGVVSDYSSAVTNVSIIDNGTDVTANYVLAISPSIGVVADLTGTTITVTHIDDATDAGSVSITATKSGSPTLTRLFNIAKSKQGNTGAGGSTNATLSKYALLIPAQSDGTVTTYAGAASTITIYSGTDVDTPNWTITKADSAGITSQLVGATVTVTNMTNATDTGTVTFTGTKAGSANVVLVFTITKAKQGTAAAAVTMMLTKDTWTFSTDSAGNIPSYLGASTSVNVYMSTQDDTVNWTLSKVDSAGVTSTQSGTTFTVTNMLGTTDSGTVTITANKAGNSPVSKVFSLSKSKAGTPGSGSGAMRGSMTFYIPNRTSWSDAVATAAASVFGGPVLNDAVTQYDMATGFSDFRVWNGTTWVKVTQVIDANLIVNGTIAGTKFASGIQPVGLGATLPNPATATTKTFFNTTDGKLYRLVNGAWTTVVPAVDITGQLSDAQLQAISAAKLTGQITTTQIAPNSISTPLLQAGAVSANNIAAGAIVAGKIAAGAITATELAAGAVTATKIAAGSITAAQIAADTITAGQIAAGAISATELAAGAITAQALAAGIITADKIAVNAITADRIATGTITAQSGVLANAAVGTLQIAGQAVTVASAFAQDPQVQVSSSFSWTNICTATLNLSGMQPMMIMASCSMGGQHIGSPSNYDIYYQGQYYKFNSNITGGDFRFQVFNGGVYQGITGTVVAGGTSIGVPIFALLPVLPAGFYTIYLQAIVGTAGGPSNLEPYTVREARMICLETKR